MESRASSTCWLCGRRRGGRLALSAGIAWPRFRRDAVGPGLAGVERAEQMNSLKEIRNIPQGRAVAGSRSRISAAASARARDGFRLRSMWQFPPPRCQHGMAATEERRVGRAGVWCDVLTLPMCTEPYTSPLTLTGYGADTPRWRKYTSPCAAAIGAAAAEFTSFLSSAALVSFRSQRFVCHELRALLTTGYPVKGPEARRNSISADEGNFGTSLKIPVQAGGAEGASEAPTGTVLSRPTGPTVS